MTLIELLGLLRNRLRLVVALPLIFALLTAVVSWAVLPNTYTANVSLYVLTKSDTAVNPANNYSDLTASQMLTNDVSALMKSDRVMADTAKKVGLDSLGAYKISVTSATTTRVITVAVTGTDAAKAAAVANGLASTTDTIARQVMDLQAVNVIDEAVAPSSPSGPPRGMYVLVALLAGLFVAIAAVVVMDMVNTRVRTPEEASELLDLPVIGQIPTIR